MDEETLKRVQMTVNEILTVIDKFCRKYAIPYYLFYGSELGAVRHHGFIPWDDDADIIMFRKDYDRFRELWLQNPVEGYFFQDVETDKGYNMKFAKIRKKNTAFAEVQNKALNMHHGIFVDIFVLDDYVKNGFLRRVTELITMFDFNAKRRYVPEHAGRYLYRVTNQVFKNDKIRNWWYQKVFPKLKKDDTMCSDILSFTFSHKYDFKREWLGTPQYVDYDGFQLPVPENTHETLKVCYGDYMTPPPEERQISTHKPYYLSFDHEYHPGLKEDKDV